MLVLSHTAVVVVCGRKVFLCVTLIPYRSGCCLWTEGFSVCYSHPLPQWLLFVDRRFFCVLLSSLPQWLLFKEPSPMRRSRLANQSPRSGLKTQTKDFGLANLD